MNIRKIMWVLVFCWFNTAIFAADWVVDNTKSGLNFISIKKGSVGEIHQFKTITGKLDTEGKFTLKIDLASVDTHIPIRDQRIKMYLFEVNDFATATLTAKIKPEILKDITEGNNKLIAVDANLSLHGKTHPLKLKVIVTRLVGGQLSVVSAEPVLLNAKDFSLVAGIEKLKELAKLPSISYVVPVTFNLILKLKH